jgi:tetratricopeptide (TPR) repeat protein
MSNNSIDYFGSFFSSPDLASRFRRFFLRFLSMTPISSAAFAFLRAAFLLLLAATGLLRPALALDTNAAPEAALTNAAAASTGAQDSLRSNLPAQEQLPKTQAAIETNWPQAEAAAASNSLVLEERLRLMEDTLANDHVEQLRGIERSEQMILIAAGAFAVIGFLMLLLAAFLLWLAFRRLSAAAASFSAAHSPHVLGLGDAPLPPTRALEQSNTRFLALMERLEQRLHQLEASVKPPRSLSESNSADGQSYGPATDSSPGEIPPPVAPDKTSVINLLLNKSQTLLKLDKPEASLECLEELLTFDPDNADALVKKGAALERLQRLDEAIQCYDRAIAQDNSMTMAYLYKGSVLNRTERFGEALACYDQALKRAGKTPGPPSSPADKPLGSTASSA